MANIKCPSCGSPNVEQIDVDQYQCPYCGKSFNMRPTPNVQPTYPNVQPTYPNARPAYPNQPAQMYEGSGAEDKPGCLMGGLSFLFPLVGFVYYLMKRKTQPNSAKTYLWWAIGGFILGLIFNFIAASGSSS